MVQQKPQHKQAEKLGWKIYYKLSAVTEKSNKILMAIYKEGNKVLTSITPMLLSSISSWFTLLVFVCKRLDINLITFKRVFPTGGSNTPQVVFMTLFWKRYIHKTHQNIFKKPCHHHSDRVVLKNIYYQSLNKSHCKKKKHF